MWQATLLQSAVRAVSIYGIEWYREPGTGSALCCHTFAEQAASRVARRMLLSMFRGERAFLTVVLKTISSAGDCYAPARPLRYPRDACHQDLTRIGKDMYTAIGWYAAEKNGVKPERAG